MSSTVNAVACGPNGVRGTRVSSDAKTDVPEGVWVVRTRRGWGSMFDDAPLAAVELDEEVGFVLNTLKTTPGLRMPMADECDRSGSQSVFEVDEEEVLFGLLSWEFDMVKRTRRRVFIIMRKRIRSSERAAITHIIMHVALRPSSSLYHSRVKCWK